MKSTALLVTLSCFLASPLSLHAQEPAPATRPATQPAHHDIKVDEFEKLSAQPNHVILDVRTPAEYAAGHIPGAVLLDIKSPDFDKQIGELDKSKTYLVHCATGRRSLAACDKLAKLDFASLYNLLGGFKAWESAGKPVEKK